MVINLFGNVKELVLHVPDDINIHQAIEKGVGYPESLLRENRGVKNLQY